MCNKPTASFPLAPRARCAREGTLLTLLRPETEEITGCNRQYATNPELCSLSFRSLARQGRYGMRTSFDCSRRLGTFDDVQQTHNSWLRSTQIFTNSRARLEIRTRCEKDIGFTFLTLRHSSSRTWISLFSSGRLE